MIEARPNFYKRTPRRAMGSETEYTVQSDNLPSLKNSPGIQSHLIFENSTNDTILENGARLYYDMDYDGGPLSIVEYATPECLSGEQVLVHEKAGEHIVTKLAYEAAPRSPTGYPVFKRSSYVRLHRLDDEDDLEDMSVGHHENYSSPLTYERELPIFSYLVTRPLWAGAGIVTPAGFEMSQKRNGINFTSDKSSITGHGEKTPLRFRDDRLEIRAGDGNMSPWAIRTKYAMTSLVLRLVEHNAFPRDAIFSSKFDMEMSAYTASVDPLKTLEGLRSRAQNAVSHQARIAAAAYDFAMSHDVPQEERKAAEDIITICASFQGLESLAQVADSLADRVDWAAKLQYIRRQVGIRGVKFSDVTTKLMRNVQHDLLWEAMGRGAPSEQHYTNVDNTVSAAKVTRALHTPPNTRARSRVQIVEQYDDLVDVVDWDRVTFADGTKEYLLTPYPKKVRKTTPRS